MDNLQNYYAFVAFFGGGGIIDDVNISGTTSMTGWYMNDKLEGIWKKATVTLSRYMPGIQKRI
jgi:hypothetical protein